MYYSYYPYAPAYACPYCPYMDAEEYNQESIDEEDYTRGEKKLGYKGVEYDPDQKRLIALPFIFAAGGAAAGPAYGPRPPYFRPPFYGPRPPYFGPPFFGPRPPFYGPRPPYWWGPRPPFIRRPIY